MQNQTDYVREWITIADHDLGTAKLIFTHIPEYKDMIGFHCQQAIEKYLKGYLVYLRIKFLYVHDLIYLLDLIKQKDEFSQEFYKMASTVEDFAVEIRYPKGRYNPNELEVKSTIEYAEKFRELIINKISKKN